MGGCIVCTKKSLTIHNKISTNAKDDKLAIDASCSKVSSFRKQSHAFSEIKITNDMLVKKTEDDPYSTHKNLKTIGEGAYGKVYLVEHIETKQLRAMKVINKGNSVTKEQEELYINEIEVLKTIDHPNIIKIFEYYLSPKRVYLLTEFCSGGELFDRILEVRHFTEEAAANIMRQLLSAVSCIHYKGVIHRDLKPENILIDTKKERNQDYFVIKLIDFGTSAYKNNKEMLKNRYGTPYYIAPEVLNGTYGEKCDIWSCGVILYILLSGIPPFSGKNDNEIYENIKTKEISFKKSTAWSAVSIEAKNFILALMEKNQSNRLSADQALNHPWLKKMFKIDSYGIKAISLVSTKAGQKTITSINNSFDTNKLFMSNPEFEKNKKVMEKVMTNIKQFRAEQKLQQAAIAFIVHHMTLSEETTDLRNIFMQLDEDGNGCLSKKEIEKGLYFIMSPGEAAQEVDKIFDIIDRDKNGRIEYEEFLRASLSLDKIINEQNLKFAFNIFDKDKSGKISAEEVKTILGIGLEINNESWQAIINQDDLNGDGEISYSEFEKMMYSFLQQKKQS